MRRRIDVTRELKRLSLDGYIGRAIWINRDVQSRPDRYGHTTWTTKKVLTSVVDIEGTTVEYNFLLKLLRAFKQTRVKSVTVEAVPGGVHILFDRAFYFLKGIKDG